MKRIIAIIMAVITMAALFTACGKESEETDGNTRVLFNLNLEKYIELGDYKNIPVDTSSDTFEEYYNNVIENDISQNNLYAKKTEGTVADGDIANIDFAGKIDGVAFDGGTDQGYDLEIGSNSFIDGFEEGLVGVKIGDTVDLDLKFPNNYHNADYAGKDVVFTVTVNYVKSNEGLSPEEYYADLGYDSLEKYEESVKKRAINVYLMDTVNAKSKVKDYPKLEQNKFYKEYKASVESNISSNSGMNLTDYLKNIGQTEAEFKANALEEQINPMLDQLMLIYAIADAEDIALNEEVNKKVNAILKENNQGDTTAEDIKEYYTKNYGDYYLEYMTAYENIIDIIYDNADIK